jgi:septum formation protein
MLKKSLVLASSSPRRFELLTTLGVDFECQPADIDEAVRAGEPPLGYVQRMAREKSAVVAARQGHSDYVVLAADTTVVIDGEILGKPDNHAHALAILERLSGRSHTVTTALCLQTKQGVTARHVNTTVRFVSFNTEVCEAYLATDEPWDKAGSYGIQGLGGAFVREINGSYSNVVGLPLTEVWEMLCDHGIATALSYSRE